MSWTAISTVFVTDASTWTFAPPAGSAVGDLAFVTISNRVNATVTATTLSSSNVTWTFGVSYLGPNTTMTAAIFLGKITSTSSASVTVTWSGTAPATVRGDGQVFRSTVGSWSLDSSAVLDNASGTAT